MPNISSSLDVESISTRLYQTVDEISEDLKIHGQDWDSISGEDWDSISGEDW